MRLPSGEFVEIHEPISAEKAWTLTQHEQPVPLALSETDERGVKRPGAIKNKLRNRMSRAHAVAVPKVNAQDLKEIEHH
jgi:ubiquinol-cytochrome c reductase cytochrome b subunit